MKIAEFNFLTNDGRLHKLDTIEEAIGSLNNKGFVWMNIFGAASDELTMLASSLGLHQLSLDELRGEAHMPKMDEFPDYTFITFSSLHYEDERLVSNPVVFLAGTNYLLTVSGFDEGSPYPFEGIMPVIERNRITAGRGPAWLMYLIMDFMVDNMADIVEQAEIDIDQAEEEILSSTSEFSPLRLTYLRRNMLAMRKVLFYGREVLMKIIRNDHRWVPDKAIIHYRDVLNHVSAFLEMSESSRDNVNSLMELYASMLNNKMARDANQTNATVRRLTVITTVFMPLTFVAGVFGMSEWTVMTGGQSKMLISYGAFAGLMVIIGLVCFFFIRWLEKKDRLL